MGRVILAPFENLAPEWVVPEMFVIFLATIAADASLRGGATPRGMAAATRAAVLRQAAASASTILATAALAAPWPDPAIAWEDVQDIGAVEEPAR